MTSWMKKLKEIKRKMQAERRDKAIAKKEILADRYGRTIFVHPYSGHVYSAASRYPVRLSDLADAIFNFMDGIPRRATQLFGLNGAQGIAYVTHDAWGRPVHGMPIRAYKESEQEEFMRRVEAEEAPFSRWRQTGTQEYGMPDPGRYMFDVPEGMVSGLGLLEDNIPYAIWRLDNMLTGYHYTPYFGVPYYDKNGSLKMALGRHQWEAQQQYMALMNAGMVSYPYMDEVSAEEFGFDMATRMV